MKARCRVVVTGFEPFGQATQNPTLDVLAQLRAANDIDVDLTTIQLPVESGKIAAITSAHLDELDPDIWISLGLAAGLAVVAVEKIAANVMDFTIPDNAGVQHAGEPIFERGPAAHFATLPVKSIVTALRQSGIPAKISNSPSTYLCNQMMYTVLHLIAEKRMKTRAGFLHVPAHPSYVAAQNYPFVEMPSMSVDLMTAAVKTAIATTVRIERDAREPAIND